MIDAEFQERWNRAGEPAQRREWERGDNGSALPPISAEAAGQCMRALITDWRRMVYVYNQMIGARDARIVELQAAIAGGDNFAVLKRALAGLNPSFRVIASEAERWRCELFFSEMWAEVERVERKGEINDV